MLQFLKPANFIFLLTAILQCITVISALSPFTAVAPFIVVLAIRLVREGYEDYVLVLIMQKRYKNDKETNTQMTTVLQGGRFVPCKWEQLHVGDLVKVTGG